MQLSTACKYSHKVNCWNVRGIFAYWLPPSTWTLIIIAMTMKMIIDGCFTRFTSIAIIIIIKGGNATCKILKIKKNFSTVGSFFTSRWQTFICVYLSLLNTDYTFLYCMLLTWFEVSNKHKCKKEEKRKNLFARRPQDRLKITNKKKLKCGLNEQCQMSSRCLLLPQFIYFIFGWRSRKERKNNKNKRAT